MKKTCKVAAILMALGMLLLTGAEAQQPTVRVVPAQPPEPVITEWINHVEVGYHNGAYIKSRDDRFALKMNVGVQPHLIYQDNEGDDDEATFKIRRARYYLSGNAVYPWLHYSTQLTLEGSGAAIRDAYLEARFFDYLRPRTGQFKVPFDREYLNSGFSLPFIERSIASSRFSLQRDIGLQLAGELPGRHLAYAGGMFNGSGGNQANQNTRFMYVGRVVWNPFEPYPYVHPPFGRKDEPLLAIGVGAGYLPDLEPGERDELAGVLGNPDIVPVRSDIYKLTADLAFSHNRFSMEAGYYLRNIDPKESTDIYAGTDAWGMYAQAGYFLIPDHFEVLGRYSYIDPDNPTGIDNNREHEATIGLNYFIFDHRLKTQLNYSYFRTVADPEDLTDNMIQATMVLFF